jgi:hypothetical protein
MTDTATKDMTQEQFASGLRDWASGSLPHQAAAEFLIAAELPFDNQWLFKTDGRMVWPNWDEVESYLIGGEPSGGERAIWALVISMVKGELYKHYWTLDPTRQGAFVFALALKSKG